MMDGRKRAEVSSLAFCGRGQPDLAISTALVETSSNQFSGPCFHVEEEMEFSDGLTVTEAVVKMERRRSELTWGDVLRRWSRHRPTRKTTRS